MPAIEAFGVHTGPTVRHLQHHHGLVDDGLSTLEWRDLNDHVGQSRNSQQVLHLTLHNPWPTEYCPDGALIQDHLQKWPFRMQEPLLPRQSSRRSLFDHLGLSCRVADRKHSLRVRAALQQSMHHSQLKDPRCYRLRLHVDMGLKPIRVLNARIPVHPPPEPPQCTARIEQFIGYLHQFRRHAALTRLIPGDVRPAAVQQLAQLLLREAGQLPVEPHLLAEQLRRTGRQLTLEPPMCHNRPPHAPRASGT